MTAIQLYTIYCDHWENGGRLGCKTTLPTQETEPEQARGFAEFNGWDTTGTTDKCPKHNTQGTE